MLIDAQAESPQRISFGCSSLDTLTEGGLLADGGISELYGEPGSGKTQICLQLIVSCVKMNLNCAYVNTEKNFPIDRLSKMIQSVDVPDSMSLLDSVWIAEEKDPSAINLLLKRDLKTLLGHRKLGLLVIDSIAGLFRDLTDDLKMRAKGMRQLNRQLLQIQDEHKLAIVCTNQVSSSIDLIPLLGGTPIRPCLGPIWTEFLTNRFLVTKHRHWSNSSFFRLQVEFSPYLRANSHSHFVISKSGLQNASPDDD